MIALIFEANDGERSGAIENEDATGGRLLSRQPRVSAAEVQ